MSWRHKKQPVIHLLKGLNEFLGFNWWWVDDLINVLAVAVCIGSGDVNEGLEVVHLMGQAEELLCGNHIQLQGVPAREKKNVLNSVCSGGVGGRKCANGQVCTLKIKCVLGEGYEGVCVCQTANIAEDLHAEHLCLPTTEFHSNENLHTSVSL